MTQKISLVIAALAIATLAGFVIVSNLIGARPVEPVRSVMTSAQPTATLKTQPTVAPSPTLIRANAPEAQMRANLGQAQTALEHALAACNRGDWNGAQQALADFDRLTKQLPEPQLNHPDISPLMQDFLTLYRVQLARAITQSNAQNARFAVNQLFGIISEQRARFGTRAVPLEFQRIKFLIREVEYWSQASDSEMLAVRVAALREAWRDVRPVIVARRGGASHADNLARNFDDLMDQLSAPQPDFNLLLGQLDHEFEQMNGLFQRPGRSSTPTVPTASPIKAGDEE